MKVTSVRDFTVDSVEQFIKLKKFPLFDNMRQQGKRCGLAFLFGRGPLSFALRDLELAWPEDEVDRFIESNNLEDMQRDIFEKKKDLTLFQSKLVACATFIRKTFYQTYPGIGDRIEANRRYAKNNGFIRSVHGAMRRVPQLLLSGKDDREMNGVEMSGISNIVTNTDIQAFESAIINRAIAEIHEWLIENKMKSRLIDQTHDAISMYVHRDEKKAVYNKVKEATERMWPEFWKIPLEVEGKHCDPKTGGYYKHGADWTKYL